MEDRTTTLLVYPYTLKKVSDRKGSAVVFIREKKTDCANYREVDIIPRTEAAEQAARGVRKEKSMPQSKKTLTTRTPNGIWCNWEMATFT